MYKFGCIFLFLTSCGSASIDPAAMTGRYQVSGSLVEKSCGPMNSALFDQGIWILSVTSEEYLFSQDGFVMTSQDGRTFMNNTTYTGFTDCAQVDYDYVLILNWHSKGFVGSMVRDELAAECFVGWNSDGSVAFENKQCHRKWNLFGTRI